MCEGGRMGGGGGIGKKEDWGGGMKEGKDRVEKEGIEGLKWMGGKGGK